MFSRNLASLASSRSATAALLRQPGVQQQCRRILAGLQPQQRLQLQRWATSTFAQQPRRLVFTQQVRSFGSSSSGKQQPQRPISPHVTIYDFPLNAISSITNRVTGCVLAGILFLAAASANLGSHPDIAGCLHGFKVCSFVSDYDSVVTPLPASLML